jgi:hypothetical protein
MFVLFQSSAPVNACGLGAQYASIAACTTSSLGSRRAEERAAIVRAGTLQPGPSNSDRPVYAQPLPR